MKKFKLFVNKFMLIMFFIIMILMFSLNNLFIQWFLMEFSTIMAITFINFNNNKMASILYYSMSSISSLFLILLLLLFHFQIYSLDNFNYFLNLMLQLFLFMKIGIFPFSYLMIYMYSQISWEDIFIMSTFMKFIPLYFMSNLIYLNEFMLYLVMFNSYIISMFAKKFNSIKKIIACSSINQMSFMVLLLNLDKIVFFVFMIMYMSIFYLLCLLMSKLNLDEKIDIIMFKNNKFNQNLLTMVFIIYSMIPPFSSFMIKWLFIVEMCNINFEFLFFFIVLMSSLFMIWNYFSLMDNMLLNQKFNYNIYISNKYHFSIMFYIILMFNLFMFIIIYLY